MNDGLAIKKQLGRRFVFSLALAFFGTYMLDVLASLLLVDLAKTFLGNSNLASIAIVSQIVTISSIAAVVTGVLNGFLSVRVSHRKLLLLGALCIVVGTMGCYLAPNLLFMAIFYPLDGVGTIIVGAMAFTIIGESLPLEQRAKSIGIVAAAGIFSSAMGFAFAGYIAAVGGWRSYLLWYVLPISLIAIGFAYFTIPRQPRSEPVPIEKSNFLGCLKEVLANKSATACLFSFMLMGVAAVWMYFSATFWRNQFDVSVQNTGIITLVILIIYATGSLFGGRIINSYGRKPVVVTSWTIRGLLTAAIVFMPNFWSAFIATCLFTFIGGISVTSSHSLNLEQVKKFRGTMMSFSQVFAYVGASIGTALGGLVLGAFGFQLLGITLGLFAVGSAFVVLTFAKDPSKQGTQHNEN